MRNTPGWVSAGVAGLLFMVFVVLTGRAYELGKKFFEQN
jgi:hypothetical protein